MKPKILLLIFFILSIPVIFPFLNQHAVANLSTISFATVAKYNPPDITTLPGVISNAFQMEVVGVATVHNQLV